MLSAPIVHYKSRLKVKELLCGLSAPPTLSLGATSFKDVDTQTQLSLRNPITNTVTAL